MAKPLSERTRIMRRGIGENPDVKNAELASLLNTQYPGHEFKPQDIAQQRVQLKKAVDTTGFLPAETPVQIEDVRAPEEPDGDSRPVARPAPPAPAFGPADVKLLAQLVRKAGGVKAIHQWLDMIADMGR